MAKLPYFGWSRCIPCILPYILYTRCVTIGRQLYNHSLFFFSTVISAYITLINHYSLLFFSIIFNIHSCKFLSQFVLPHLLISHGKMSCDCSNKTNSSVSATDTRPAMETLHGLNFILLAIIKFLNALKCIEVYQSCKKIIED